MKKLVVISHTEHQVAEDGSLWGWGPTVREIDFLARHWDQVVHVACLEKGQVKGSSKPYTSRNVAFIGLPITGGQRLWQKLDLLVKIWPILWRVHWSLNGASEVQLRLPMGPGSALMAYFFLMRPWRTYKLWVKWASNWIGPARSLNYRIQRFFLRKNLLACPVTVNGRWPGQPAHCHTFENPAIDRATLEDGKEYRKDRRYHKPYHFLFIGRVTADKGIDLVLESMTSWPQGLVSKVTILGDGELRGPLIHALKMAGTEVHAPGFVGRQEVFDYCRQADFLLHPSKREGFPKVVIEAMNFGCLPITTPVGSIPYYLSDWGGDLVMSGNTTQDLLLTLQKIDKEDPENYRRMVVYSEAVLAQFTLESYFKKLTKLLAE